MKARGESTLAEAKQETTPAIEAYRPLTPAPETGNQPESLEPAPQAQVEQYRPTELNNYNQGLENSTPVANRPVTPAPANSPMTFDRLPKFSISISLDLLSKYKNDKTITRDTVTFELKQMIENQLLTQKINPNIVFRNVNYSNSNSPLVFAIGQGKTIGEALTDIFIAEVYGLPKSATIGTPKEQPMQQMGAMPGMGANPYGPNMGYPQGGVPQYQGINPNTPPGMSPTPINGQSFPNAYQPAPAGAPAPNPYQNTPATGAQTPTPYSNTHTGAMVEPTFANSAGMSPNNGFGSHTHDCFQGSIPPTNTQPLPENNFLQTEQAPENSLPLNYRNMSDEALVQLIIEDDRTHGDLPETDVNLIIKYLTEESISQEENIQKLAAAKIMNAPQMTYDPTNNDF